MYIGKPFFFFYYPPSTEKNYLEMPKFMAYTRKPHWSIVVVLIHTHYYFLFKLWTLWSKLHHISFQFTSELNINKLLRLKKININYTQNVKVNGKSWKPRSALTHTHTKESSERCPPTFKLMKTIKMWIEQGRFLSSFFLVLSRIYLYHEHLFLHLNIWKCSNS